MPMMPKMPEELFEDLYVDLHLSHLWEDYKMISDAIPVDDPDLILANYQENKNKKDFDLKQFFEQNFRVVHIEESGYESDTSMSVEEHIEELWDVLSRESLDPVKGSSALPLPKPYIVPGGRFNEIYYWDSFFTMLGLKVSGRIEMIENMIDNFAFMVDTYGFIPNGSRTYFLSRSQPPFFAMMVNLLSEIKGEDYKLKYSAELQAEYEFWMRGAEDLESNNKCKRRVVQIKDGYLNRYYDDHSSPRPEMFGADVTLFKESGREAYSLYRNLRCACESGWDFSSRWLGSSQQLNTIHATHILPVDQNCLLYFLEKMIADCHRLEGNEAGQLEFEKKASDRKALIRKIFWDDDHKFFMDYDFRDKHSCYVKSLAGVFPLSFGIATEEQAKHVAECLEQEFLKEGGLVTTLNHSGQQWDAPNGWAPLQYMAVTALRRYGYDKLADEIRDRWLKLNIKVYKDTGKMLEKYNVENMDLLSGGGEYPVQDGFGWTNGVFLHFMNEKNS